MKKEFNSEVPCVFAHSLQSHLGSQADSLQWEPLYSPDCPKLTGKRCHGCEELTFDHGHLNKVGTLAAKFAEEMFLPGSNAAKEAYKWGFAAGMWHDLGKFDSRFQALLRGRVERATHSTAGAQFAVRSLGGIGQPLAYVIAGHHAGLADLIGGDSSLRSRIEGEDFLSELQDGWTSAATDVNLTPPLRIEGFSRNECASAYAFFTRFLFSCLVDADFLATESFVSAQRSRSRANWPRGILADMDRALEQRYQEFDPVTPISSEIDKRRSQVRSDCISAANRSPGFFTLTVPTGGGKTLASLVFALKHAQVHNLRRVIYVVPYTSIIEQNANEYRRIFADISGRIGRDVVLEHHSNFDPSEVSDGSFELAEDSYWKLDSENWDAPLIVTTSVQFFESLYANRTSRCRKLHRIARSIVVLDEAQSLPPELLAPCLDSLKQLTLHFGTSVVLCTATQPALGKLDPSQPGDFIRKFNEIALDLSNTATRRTEIIDDVPLLFSGLNRTRIEDLGSLTDQQIVSELIVHNRVLCILNTKPHAAEVFELLGAEDRVNIHLSAQLCPAHRSAVLHEIRRREKTGEPCRVIATTVVEAGVDIDFPVVYRAMTGLDSLAQAAGRCNRHGKLENGGGKVFLFSPSERKPPRFLNHNLSAARNVLPNYRGNPSDLIHPKAIEEFFRHFYFAHEKWDQHGVLKCFNLSNDNPKLPLLFNFRSAAQNFRLIPEQQLPVIIEPKPNTWRDQNESKSAEIQALINSIREADKFERYPPAGSHWELQRYTVQIPKSIHQAMVDAGEIRLCCDGRFPILVHPENDYDSNLGLRLPNHVDQIEAFVV